MIGHSLQCAANNGLYAEENPLKSEAVSIDPYTAARLLQDNFQVYKFLYISKVDWKNISNNSTHL